MKLISLFFIPLIFSVTLHAQSWENLNDQILKLVRSHEYDSALPIAKKALLLAEKEFGKDNSDYSASLNNLASIYKELGQYEAAEPLYLQCVQIVRKLLKEDNPDLLSCLKNLAELYQLMEKFQKAESLYLEVAGILKRSKGETSEDYLLAENTLADLYQTMEEYDKAETLYLHIKETLKKTSGETGADYIQTLNNLASLYYSKKDYKSAIPLFLEVLAKRKTQFGENDLTYIQCLMDLASSYQQINDKEKVEAIYLSALRICKTNIKDFYEKFASAFVALSRFYTEAGQYEKAIMLFNENIADFKKGQQGKQLDYASVVHETARAFSQMAQYDKSIAMFREVAWIEKENGGTENPDYAINCYHWGQAYQKTGRYDSAEILLTESARINKKTLGENSTDYAQNLYGLGLFYADAIDYPRAEKLLYQAREIIKKGFGEQSVGYAECTGSIGTLYVELGLFEKAKPLLLETLAIEKKLLGEDHPYYAATLNNLGGLYNEWGSPDDAELYYWAALEIRNRILGKLHPDYSESLNNLAGVYEQKKEYQKAIDLYTESAAILKNNLGENNADYSNVVSNLALAYLGTGDYNRAESLYIAANNINKKVLGDHHPQYAIPLSNLAMLYLDKEEYDKSERMLMQARKIELSDNLNNFSILTEKEKTNSLGINFGNLFLENNLCLRQINKPTALAKFNFDQILLLKSLSLSDTKNLMEEVRNSKDTTVKSLFKKWQGLKTRLAKQYSLPVADRIDDADKLERQADDLEKKLNTLSSEFHNQRQSLKLTTQDIRQNLEEDEAAIEFVSFNLYNKRMTDTVIYAAYILRKNDSIPRFVPLCEEKQLGKYFSSAGGADNIKALYRSEISDDDEKPSISGDSLYSLVWKPLLPYLKGIKKIAYSPSGLLYKIAFHALPAGDSQLLIDKYELNQYTSVRQLALAEKKNTNNKSITLFGDCMFSMDSTAIVKNTPAKENANTLITARGGNGAAWNNLPGTMNEVKNISLLFEKNKTITRSYKQQQATEEQFKSLSGNSPAIIHLATHGFFLPDPETKKQEGFATDKRNAFTLADDPLLRSGIVLSGANRVWSGKAPIAGREDGIVTAYEIAQLDLTKTDLVVLSACETALGDIKGNEGVFGLQRAFKLAGVKNMLLSLWRVPDAETAELMTVFYNYYIGGKTIREAFNAAQKDMRAKYKPYYWAAFVLIE